LSLGDRVVVSGIFDYEPKLGRSLTRHQDLISRSSRKLLSSTIRQPNCSACGRLPVSVTRRAVVSAPHKRDLAETFPALDVAREQAELAAARRWVADQLAERKTSRLRAGCGRTRDWCRHTPSTQLPRRANMGKLNMRLYRCRLFIR
jgi:hypothetical protein